ncbi:hypothetical protein HK098_005811 [Nowakowskiella sp. JEL0407]|nr:hypothetical protein HK098_005811 [Nowakowskiella sp. JEL0407]
MSKTFEVQDFTFLPIIVEIMDNLSKSNIPDVNADILTRETAKLTVQLKNKLIAAQSNLEELLGINNSIEEQNQILENNLKFLETKQYDMVVF